MGIPGTGGDTVSGTDRWDTAGPAAADTPETCPTGQKTLSSLRLITCFGAIGFAFLFIEMAFIQRFILFLHHPLYAAVLY
ncbi:MAG: hypothetical protein Ct9H300mP16_04120 [Pseudomonadota bacterium]|nr:MAG: hypothetical protein Ct9H300mP16_04120 [Pseudomonadota bacterium]